MVPEMKAFTTKLGDLTVRIVGESANPTALVVFCHGYGAPGTDLVGLAPELVELEPSLAEARFVFPEAPLVPEDLGPWGGRAWWPIDLAAVQEAQMKGLPRVLADTEPDGMGSARKKLMTTIEAALAQAKLGWGRVILGGFSQGAMLAVDAALRADEPPRGVIAFSPTLLCEAVWRRYAARRAGLPVYVSHGRHDPLLPFAASEALVAMLLANGLAVDFEPFDGPHTIALEALAGAADHLARWCEPGPANATSSGT